MRRLRKRKCPRVKLSRLLRQATAAAAATAATKAAAAATATKRKNIRSIVKQKNDCNEKEEATREGGVAETARETKGRKGKIVCR